MALFSAQATAVLILSVLSIQSIAAERADGVLTQANQCFPATVEGFKTVTFPEATYASLKTDRNSVVAGYNAMQFNTAVSVFIYDREPSSSVSKELRTAISEVLAVHAGSQLTMSGKGKVPLAGSPTEAQGGLFLWSEGSTDYGSFLWLIPRNNHYVKIRATYIRPPGDAAAAEAMQFAMKSIETVASAVCSPV